MRSLWRETKRALRRDTLLVALMVTGLAVGVGFWQLGALLLRQQQRSSLETKSLFTVELLRDTGWERTDAGLDERTRVLVHTLLASRDADALRAHPALGRTAVTATGMLAVAPEEGALEEDPVRFGSSSMFEMFGLKLRSGRAFRDGAAEVVLSDDLEDRWFPGGDGVGRLVRIGGRRFRVAGVLAKERWPHQFDLRLPRRELLFASYEAYRELRPWPDPVIATPDRSAFFTRPDSAEDPTTRLWVEIDPDARPAYEEFLRQYVSSQQGRMPRILRGRLVAWDGWYALASVAEGTYIVAAQMGILILLGCAFNLIRLAMVRSGARAAELGLLRALGEGRRSLFLRQVLEGTVIGACAGVAGAILLALFVPAFNVVIPTRPMEFFVDARAVVSAVLGGTLAGALSAAYPAWRFSRMAPAILLRRQ
jgi:putative ABC transport system permease protein